MIGLKQVTLFKIYSTGQNTDVRILRLLIVVGITGYGYWARSHQQQSLQQMDERYQSTQWGAPGKANYMSINSECSAFGHSDNRAWNANYQPQQRRQPSAPQGNPFFGQ